MNKVSILWSESDTRRSFDSFDFIDDLDLGDLFYLASDFVTGITERDIREYFTVDRQTIIDRCDMFFEFLQEPELFYGLSDGFAALADIFKLKQEKNAVGQSSELSLYSVKELEMYVQYIESMRTLFAGHNVKGAFLNRLKDEIAEIYSSEEYPRLREELKKQSHVIRTAKSVTIGVNLTAQMKPIEAGVVKINDVNFKSGVLIDKILRLDFKDDEYTCSAPLIPTTKGLTEQEAATLRFALYNALNKILTPSLQSWERTIKKYVVDNLDGLFCLLPEWQFVTSVTKELMKIKKAGGHFCKPIFSDTDDVRDLYHPILLLNGSAPRVIKNDLQFGGDRIYILTGPNQGGKSIYTRSVGLLYAMLHLGIPLPASHAEICPVDGIYTHFVDNHADRAYRNGRLAGECEAMQKISERITPESLFLFDEALSSTSADEAVTLAGEILTAYSVIGVKGICTTHLHGLCELADRDQSGRKSRICNLTARLDEGTHDRTYRIERGGKYGHSYAIDIAEKFHLTKDEIISMYSEKVKGRKGE